MGNVEQLARPALIRAVVVNHDTSPWTELVIRSSYAQHPGLDLALTVYDNASTDDRAGLLRAVDEYGVPLVPSGFTTRTENNSHGEILRRFVLDPANADCSYFLFLDTDVCFTRQGTIEQMRAALDSEEKAFGAGPRMSWDGERETPTERERAKASRLFDRRLHPACALVRNTPLFRAVVQEVGMSCVSYLWATSSQYLDTFELTTSVMRTHGLHHIVVPDALVLHAFGVSYPNDWENTLPEKVERRDGWLSYFRSTAAKDTWNSPCR
ncbi:Glycosyltransferase, GT2 family [Actinopolymorpha cephalotaxi]|uniref:Glycosyltransferase, GT2 family n=1 Tax=Actinopolymorpha cephalotaxi TaxID=504797 RepID=A0A1I2PDY1_9ACTN|nr:glycosyltransferase [Actinopolymorpha cephalotaxi]NYH83645.1 hypothetical protein [Actinopolymorpha cephalotaxi]SFG14338.1 Glycosyltransferase, GT2 family [Actinopolymorpha cephalotaxi]